MNLKRLIKSFRDAMHGLSFVFKNEQNFRIQLFFSLVILILMWIFQIKKFEVLVVLMLIILILNLEILNSAVEKFMDIVKPRLHEQVKVVKDILAAMVLSASLLAIVVGIIIFWPYFAAAMFK